MPDGTSERPRVGVLHQLPLLVWLVVLWMLLWGSLSWLNLLTGIIIALAVTRIFYLPPVELSGRFNLWWALVFVATFAWDILRGSVHVAWKAINPRSVPHSSVIAVQLHSKSDLIMLLVSINISLIPGSLVVEADRFRSVLYVHALDTESDADVEAFRQTVFTAERRIVRVIGSRSDMQLCEAPRGNV
ncbi:multisubunit sodium/proton antiporter MrpE subunit [Homoserinimonas aerilata]|uniref:Multisubunit sodium/proton antiporter MrpE subunit n=1 Tax=Homoserinimonas aerilata TaxID=1162970 RepID=A0A542YHD9_9MICO|nr:Na+/H+ antiporter subunit E [Homoserinimonas aerilata]TQL47505.1 multisubunit sodium/proton antiporter MrpE subunit [Homoserinimonas aerilata]